MKTAHKKIGIIIVNWNGLKDTLACLRSLLRDRYPDKNIIVVDNKSSDNSPKIINKTFPEIEVIENKENLGYAKATNIGIRKALSQGSHYILILNNDVTITPGSLEKLVSRADSDKKIGIVSPKILDPKSRIDSLGVKINFDNGTFLSIARGKPGNIKIKNRKELEAVAGSCFFVKKEVIKKSGFIPEEYFFYFEETDFCLAARKSGFRIVLEPGAVVYHKGGASSNPQISPFSRYYFTRNLFIFMKKNAPKKKWIKFAITGTAKILFRIMLNLGGILIKGEAKRRITWVKAYLKGMIDFWQGKIDRADYSWLSVK